MIMQYLYELLNEVDILTNKEQKNWQRYKEFVKTHHIYESEYKQKIFDYINQLGFLKREIEHKILDEYKKLESVDCIGVF